MLVAVGQENAFPWIERDIGIEFDKWDMPKVDEQTMQSTNPKVFFGGDARLRPEEHHLGGGARPRGRGVDRQAAQRRGRRRPPAAAVELISQKMGIHEWSYDNEIALDQRYKVPLRDKVVALQGHQGRGRTGLRPASSR